MDGLGMDGWIHISLNLVIVDIYGVIEFWIKNTYLTLLTQVNGRHDLSFDKSTIKKLNGLLGGGWIE